MIDEPPVRFRRAAGMRPLPVPVPGGSVETLRSFLIVRSDVDFVLVVAWGARCAAQSWSLSGYRAVGRAGFGQVHLLGDFAGAARPQHCPLRALPREDRDLFIAATNGHVLAFDNVSGLPGWISDTLCRLATGGGFAVRQLYTDQDEVCSTPPGR